MRRLPLLSALIVLAAVAAMIALGFWQLARAREKAAFLDAIERAATQPAIAYPPARPRDPRDLLFRNATVICRSPVRRPPIGGVGPGGKAGWRHIVRCAGGELVDIGWSADFAFDPQWPGGPMRGVIAELPRRSSLVARAFGEADPPELVVIAAASAAGLSPTVPPSREDVPNNHIAYAVQWFFFAAIAIAIYLLAVWRARR